ncbi:MAG: cell division protein ZapE [Deferribacteraceae bacterium]|nr:cell division protein ZapE [Deferribacteraceae bacterium]
MFTQNALAQFEKRGMAANKDQVKAIQVASGLLKKQSFFLKSLALVKPTARPAGSVTGIYIWGLPGRGKSSVMDACLEAYKGSKIRLHFHEFLKSFIKLLDSKDSLELVVDRWLAPYKLICFDEFHVHDIGDTMMVLRFLQRAIKRKHTFIFTSNYRPDQLQPDPIFHDHFLPAIKLIEHKFEVIPFTFEHDYRALNRLSDDQRLFLLSSDADAHPSILGYLRQADPSFKDEESEIKLSGRPFKVIGSGEKAVAFRFEDLCGTASSYIDYIELTNKWESLYLSDIYEEHFKHRHTMQRFTWLLDVLYDRRIKLYTTSQKPLIAMLQESPSVKDVERVVSRLYEMESMHAGLI